MCSSFVFIKLEYCTETRMTKTNLHSPLLSLNMDFPRLCLSKMNPRQGDFPAGEERAPVDLACFTILNFSNMQIMVCDAKTVLSKTNQRYMFSRFSSAIGKFHKPTKK